ncbi:MAG TPA: right-handed parallel beta-helix repeat-containing protein [Candidatus Limnocylindrales bacterium]
MAWRARPRHARGLLPPVVALLLATSLASSALAADPSPAGAGASPVAVVRVPQDATLEAAIDRSTPGTLILLDRGTYPGGILVPEDRGGITIRGVDRNDVVFDGQDTRVNAIEILADDVVLENMTAHNYTLNGFYWEGVDGFAGRYLTVWNVGLYGIYAIESRNGIFEQSLVSGAADAAFYVGECNPCDTVVSDVIARDSAIGYSGTNAGGNLEIRDSLWERNGTAIMPNSFEGQPAPPPQRSSRITGNTIRDSGSVPVPANSPLAGYVGMGIAIAGGTENEIEDNEVTGSATYGIALYPSIQRDGSAIQPIDNIVRGNTVSQSGRADLAVAAGSAEANCFVDNDFTTSQPADIEVVLGCDTTPSSTGDDDVASVLAIPIPEALDRLGPRPDYTAMAPPDAQPTMPPDATTGIPGAGTGDAAEGPSSGATVAAIVAVALVASGIVAAVIVLRRRRRAPAEPR